MTHLLENIIRVRVGPDEVVNTVVNTALADGPEVTVAIEEETGSSGKLTTAFFQQKLPGFVVVPIKPDSKKKERAFHVAVAQNSGNLLLTQGEWNEPFEDEAINFTGDKDPHDDQVDALAMSYNWLNDYEETPALFTLDSNKEELAEPILAGVW